MAGCRLDATVAENVKDAPGPLAICFNPGAVWKGIITAAEPATKTAAASVGPDGQPTAPSLQGVPPPATATGVYVGDPIPNFLRIGWE